MNLRVYIDQCPINGLLGPLGRQLFASLFLYVCFFFTWKSFSFAMFFFHVWRQHGTSVQRAWGLIRTSRMCGQT